MATSNLFWRLFAQTGSIDAYLAYRRLHAAPSPFLSRSAAQPKSTAFARRPVT